MFDTRQISSVLQKRLASLRRDGVSVDEAAGWLVESGVLSASAHPTKLLRALLRDGKIRGAYQFPNKRWVVINRMRLPDGIHRVVPVKEAAEWLEVSERSLRRFLEEDKLKSLKFGASVCLFLEDDLKRFRKKFIDRSYELEFPQETRKKRADLDRLRRQLYYLRSDVRLIAERIEELIKLLE